MLAKTEIVITEEMQEKGNALLRAFGLTDALPYLGDIYRRMRALEPASEDTKRLDWLDTRRDDLVEPDKHGDPELVGREWGVRGQCDSVREAIDREVQYA